MQPITIAIAGCGSRGLNCYAKMQKRYPDRMKIVAATDLIPEKLEKARTEYDLDPALCFPSR